MLDNTIIILPSFVSIDSTGKFSIRPMKGSTGKKLIENDRYGLEKTV